MKFTKKRYLALKDAFNGKDYPGSTGIRRILEKEGLLIWRGPPTYGGRINMDNINWQLWAITTKGRHQLNEWENLAT